MWLLKHFPNDPFSHSFLHYPKLNNVEGLCQGDQPKPESPCGNVGPAVRSMGDWIHRLRKFNPQPRGRSFHAGTRNLPRRLADLGKSQALSLSLPGAENICGEE